MQLARLTLAACFVLVPTVPALAQHSADNSSYALQFLKFDRNGNGKLEPAELEAMKPKEQPAPVPFVGLTLICEGEAPGGGGGGGATASEQETQHPPQTRRDLSRQAEQQFARHPLQPPLEVPQPVQQFPEHIENEAASGYQVAPPPPQPPEPEPPQSVGLSKAVQYRLLANRQRQQPRTQYRQAAVFGATIGLTKIGPARFQSASSCCAPRRVDIFVARRAR